MSDHRQTLLPPIRRDDLPADCREAAALLNQGCICRSVDSRRLKRALEAGGVAHEALSSSHPHLFSHTQVYVAQAHLDFMADLIGAIERVVALPGWQARVLANAPAIAGHIPRAAGVFMGYDFHLGDDGPRLIAKPYGKRVWRSLPQMKRTREIDVVLEFFAESDPR